MTRPFNLQDMVECELIDRLSILTYLSQFYQAFHDKSPHNPGMIIVTHFSFPTVKEIKEGYQKQKSIIPFYQPRTGMVICRVEFGWGLFTFWSSVGGLDLGLDHNLPLIYLGTNFRSRLGSSVWPWRTGFLDQLSSLIFGFVVFSSILLEALIYFSSGWWFVKPDFTCFGRHSVNYHSYN